MTAAEHVQVQVRDPQAVFKVCDSSDPGQQWQYQQQQAFVVNQATADVIMATGDASDTGPAPTKMSDTPDMYQAQWIHMPYPGGGGGTRAATNQLHAFRTTGNRCLEVAGGCPTAVSKPPYAAQINDCSDPSSLNLAQVFPKFLDPSSEDSNTNVNSSTAVPECDGEIEVFGDFEAMDLHENLLRGIFSYGLEKPSAIQTKGIVPTAKGLDTLMHAQSGTGKTA
eukprot:gene13782-5950_t